MRFYLDKMLYNLQDHYFHCSYCILWGYPKNLLKSIFAENGILQALLETLFLIIPALAIVSIFFLRRKEF